MSEKHEGCGLDPHPSSDTPNAVSIVPSEADIAAAEMVAGWRARLDASIATQKARKAATKAFRADHERRRQYAHPRRHAVKLEASRGRR